MWVGTRGQTEETLVPRAGLRLETLQAGPIAGLPWRTRLKNAALLARSLVPANQLMASFRPDVVLLTGGYVNVPVALVARLRRVPVAIYLPDVEPGAAIRFLSRFAARIACTAEKTSDFLPASKLVPTGYPVRFEVRAATAMTRSEALARFDLSADRPTVFVFGGSRGAQSINRALMAVLPTLLRRAQVIHVSGTLTWPEVETFARGLSAVERASYRPYSYLHEEMGAAFRAADLVVARAGASMLGEGPAFGVPAVLVPYPYAWRYQKVNADYLAEKGAALRLDDGRLSDELLPTIEALLADEPRRKAMGAAAAKLDQPDAAGRIGDILLRLAEGNA
jgi:UDP-N-acetylglucosamine--N-acetylmuramyl-(pentapeptide) pyrophosphoryl-undecaprenol N-acetylglucosamine transferase